MRIISILAIMFFTSMVHANCLDDAGQEFGVNTLIMQALAKTETNYDPKAINRSNRNKSVDVGMWQINSIHFKELEKEGIRARDLLKACVSARVATRLFRRLIDQYGSYREAVIHWNPGDPDYLDKVIGSLEDIILQRKKHREELRMALR